ncbi:type VI secretion system amidase effector protein Tae4 [Tautonia sp. JC769]|uniref:type VI secretion system amidase effector protein Tae4 n=1 Tax=Tautonia sp. JC769 TaxID=3232135 RepID=UPI00345A99B5
MKPTWVKFQAEFLDYVNYPDSGAVKTLIGGGVDAAYITNTCAIRLSRGLNESGVPLPAHRNGLLTVRGGDSKYYALRVAEMRTWLPLVLGKPVVDHRKKAGTAFDTSTLSALKGIIAFDIRFSDATGHLDSWDGLTFSSEYKVSDYWTPATRITLWSLS